MASSPPSKRRRKGQTLDGESPSKSTLTQEKSSPVVVFAHGAGAPSSSDWMIRVSSMVAALEDIAASLIVCLGYPLEGTKDSLCPLEKLEAVRKKMKAMSGLHEIEGGDHSFKISKKHHETKGLTQEEAEMRLFKPLHLFFTRSLT